MNPEVAVEFAARIVAEIPVATSRPEWMRLYAADRERVASDLAGLLEHTPGTDARFCEVCGEWRLPCDDARRYADGLLRTGLLYGVK